MVLGAFVISKRFRLVVVGQKRESVERMPSKLYRTMSTVFEKIKWSNYLLELCILCRALPFFQTHDQTWRSNEKESGNTGQRSCILFERNHLPKSAWKSTIRTWVLVAFFASSWKMLRQCIKLGHDRVPVFQFGIYKSLTMAVPHTLCFWKHVAR